MIGTELDQEFIIQPGRALLLLEAENLLAEIPPESSALRRGSHHQELPLVWDTRKIPESSRPIIFIARTTSRHNTHSEVEALLNKGHFVIAESEKLSRFSQQMNGENTQWFNEIARHPNVILCTSSDRARDLLIENICKVKTGEWTTLAITGTNGKTSTTQMTSTLLEELSHNSVLRLGTLGIQVGSHLWDNPFPTMPDYPGLLAALRAAQNDFNCRQLVMEATSIGIQENRLGQWPVQCAAYLNLTQDHLDYHGTMEKYLEAKLDLFRTHLLPNGQAVINCADPHWDKVIEAAKGKNRFCIGFGGTAQRDSFFQKARSIFSGVRFFEISHKRSSTSGIAGQWTLWIDALNHVAQCQYHVRLLGDVQHENLAAAAAMMISLGYPLNQIAQITSQVRAIAGRLEPVEMGSHEGLPCVLVDYAHSPDALEKTLLTCKSLLPEGGKLLCVFGCGGDRDPGKRPKMGRIAAEIENRVWITSDNPRTESPEKILQDITAGVPQTRLEATQTCVDRRDAIGDAISFANEKDIILIAGKGHEDYQILGTTKYPFSDSEVARQALKVKRNI